MERGKAAISIFGTGKETFEKIKSTYSTKVNKESKEQYHLRILGLSASPTLEEVKSAYRKFAKQYHPDKVSHLGDDIRELAEIKMKEINAAYAYLKGIYA